LEKAGRIIPSTADPATGALINRIKLDIQAVKRTVCALEIHEKNLRRRKRRDLQLPPATQPASFGLSGFRAESDLGGILFAQLIQFVFQGMSRGTAKAEVISSPFGTSPPASKSMALPSAAKTMPLRFLHATS
jgi:hypothetical protein